MKYAFGKSLRRSITEERKKASVNSTFTVLNISFNLSYTDLTWVISIYSLKEMHDFWNTFTETLFKIRCTDNE